ncbi:MAG: hypothetical protein EZS28_022324, partial [Streblomastix strix]
MLNVYIDERLLDTAGLSDFPELYANIKECYPKPIGELPQPVPVGDQTLQEQMKNNDDIIYDSSDGRNEEFEPPVPSAITKLDLSSQLWRQNFLASSGSDPQLIVFSERITLTASYATTVLFPGCGQLSGYLFKSYPPESRPKLGDQMIALVGTDASNTYNIFCYIDQIGPYIISSRQLPSNITLVLNITYYKQYESSKIINYDANNNKKIDIMDTWNANGKRLFEAQSKKVLPPHSKNMSIRVEQQEFSAICLFNDMYDKSSAVQVAVSGQLNMFDCEFQGTYILDNYAKSTNSNESAPEDVESNINEVTIRHEKQLSSLPQRQYTKTNMFNQVSVFNLYFESKGLQGRTQEVGRIRDFILSADSKKPQESISQDSADVYKCCGNELNYFSCLIVTSLILDSTSSGADS